jgi:hypothetical protein
MNRSQTVRMMAEEGQIIGDVESSQLDIELDAVDDPDHGPSTTCSERRSPWHSLTHPRAAHLDEHPPSGNPGASLRKSPPSAPGATRMEMGRDAPSLRLVRTTMMSSQVSPNGIEVVL